MKFLLRNFGSDLGGEAFKRRQSFRLRFNLQSLEV